MTRSDTIRFIVREWMEKSTYLPVHELGASWPMTPAVCSLVIQSSLFCSLEQNDEGTALGPIDIQDSQIA
ncbi:hypothetical protein HF258_30640 [Rhizobium leguminosarum]|nr:hypothetical protein [Rhizobium leguminosarum]